MNNFRVDITPTPGATPPNLFTGPNGVIRQKVAIDRTDPLVISGILRPSTPGVWESYVFSAIPFTVVNLGPDPHAAGPLELELWLRDPAGEDHVSRVTVQTGAGPTGTGEVGSVIYTHRNTDISAGVIVNLSDLGTGRFYTAITADVNSGSLATILQYDLTTASIDNAIIVPALPTKPPPISIRVSALEVRVNQLESGVASP